MLLGHGADPKAQLPDDGYASLALALVGESGTSQHLTKGTIPTIKNLKESGTNANGGTQCSPLFLALEIRMARS